MKDVSFTDCWAADQGGAIFAHTIGSIVLTDVRFTNCLAGFGGGGALFALGGGTISMNAVAFDNCGCDEGDGGAVYTDSAGGISLIGVAFTDCHARRIGSGGALYAINFGDLTMTDVAFLGCSAVVAGGAVVAGIFTGAGAADITTTGVTGVQPFGDISLSGVSFTNCSSANAYGAIAIFDVSGNVSVTRTRVVNCRATARCLRGRTRSPILMTDATPVAQVWRILCARSLPPRRGPQPCCSFAHRLRQQYREELLCAGHRAAWGARNKGHDARRLLCWQRRKQWRIRSQLPRQHHHGLALSPRILDATIG